MAYVEAEDKQSPSGTIIYFCWLYILPGDQIDPSWLMGYMKRVKSQSVRVGA
jgi:hypothetical protein